MLRVQYPRLLGDDSTLLHGAFALDSVLTETIFTVGPLLTAAIVVVFGPAAALVVSAVAVLVGTMSMVAALPGRKAARAGGVGRRLRALAAPGIRTLVAAMLPVGFAFGALEVALPAFAQSHGEPGLAGVLIALWSIGSIVGGLLYGARPRQAPLASVHLRMAIALPIGSAPAGARRVAARHGRARTARRARHRAAAGDAQRARGPRRAARCARPRRTRGR